MKAVALGIVAFLVLGLTPLARAEEGEIDTSQIRIRRAIAEKLTPEQLQARKEMMARRIAERRAAARPSGLAPIGELPADTCPAATPTVSSLPFGPVVDTTVGMSNDYEPALTTTPTCSAPTSCVGRPSGRGEVYAGTGFGPDRAYRIRTNANCTLTIDVNPTDSAPDEDDLSLIVYQAQCTNDLADCA